MSLNIGGYKKDIHLQDEKWMEEIQKAKKILNDALVNYFGDEITVEDVIKLSCTKARLNNHTKRQSQKEASGEHIKDIFSLMQGEINFTGNIFWYTSGITLWDKIIGIKWSKSPLTLGQKVILQWNSEWYVPTGKNGEIATIIWFEAPSDNNVDHIITIVSNSGIWKIKPSNINRELMKNDKINSLLK